MLKTEQDIERDFFKMLNESELAEQIHGKVYRSEMRPYNSKDEDCVITFISGLDEQVQTGVVSIDVYVPDTHTVDGRSVADKPRIGELQTLLLKFVHDNSSTEYDMSSETSPRTVFNEDIQQHFIYYRVKFNRINA